MARRTRRGRTIVLLVARPQEHEEKLPINPLLHRGKLNANMNAEKDSEKPTKNINTSSDKHD